MLATFHSWWTLLLLAIFVGIVIWAYSARRKKDFDEAARLALDEDDVKRSSEKGGSDG